MRKGTSIVGVEPGSAPWRRGIKSGDRILSINGEPAVDALAAVYLLSDDAPVSMEFHTEDSGHMIIDIDDPADFLSSMEFDSLRIKCCSNDCIYCFCKQNPPHARHSFNLRDEDFRMSFLAGYYTTMAAITDEEIARIVNHTLTPQYVTVPSTNEHIRSLMLGRSGARPILEVLRYLVSRDISIHVQIVVCPGFNDGVTLERTVADLASLGHCISSVVLVPVGLTRYTKDSRLRRLNAHELRDLLRLVHRWRNRRTESGGRWLEGADEVYIALNRRIPGSRQYGIYPQVTSGVGMTRRFLDDFRSVERLKRPAWWSHADSLLISGRLFGPLLTEWIGRLNGIWGNGMRVVSATNDYFGAQVTVAGLLSGTDILSVLPRGERPGILILSDDMLDPTGRRFVDNVTIEELKSRTDIREILFASTMREAFAKIGEKTG